MKEIITNKSNITDSEINRVVRRTKAIIENDNNEILLAYSYKNYQLPGGHLENEETFIEGLNREVLEETGIDISNTTPNLVLSIINYKKDFPIEDINTKYVANYYSVKTNSKPNYSLIELTSEEELGNFKLVYINKELILEELEKSLLTCSYKEVIYDTISAIKEYLNNESN